MGMAELYYSSSWVNPVPQNNIPSMLGFTQAACSNMGYMPGYVYGCLTDQCDLALESQRVM